MVVYMVEDWACIILIWSSSVTLVQSRAKCPGLPQLWQTIDNVSLRCGCKVVWLALDFAATVGTDARSVGRRLWWSLQWPHPRLRDCILVWIKFTSSTSCWLSRVLLSSSCNNSPSSSGNVGRCPLSFWICLNIDQVLGRLCEVSPTSSSSKVVIPKCASWVTSRFICWRWFSILFPSAILRE